MKLLIMSSNALKNSPCTETSARFFAIAGTWVFEGWGEVVVVVVVVGLVFGVGVCWVDFSSILLGDDTLRIGEADDDGVRVALGVFMLRERIRFGVAKLERKEEDKASMSMLFSFLTNAVKGRLVYEPFKRKVVGH
jgi:hypothetical protein